MATKVSSATLHDISSAQSRAGPKSIISVTKKSHSRHYQFKVFKSKGAVITLIWCFCSLLVYCFMMRQHKVEPINGVVVINMVAFLYPILGCVHFGRYKMIKCSVWLMWFASLLSCFSSILYLKLIHGKLFNAMKFISSAFAAFGLGGMFTNAIPFGIDQLINASSSEITSFIRWFCWVWYLGGVVIDTSMDCICHQYELASHLLFPVCLSFGLCIDFFFNRLLTKTPTSKNPLTLIFRVLKYAIKNKYPRQRSAFAYWDSQRCSRINLGKNKYGGPFSTEEVESVKTFWRIMGVVTVATFIVGLIIHTISLHEDFMNHFQDDRYVAENKANGCDLAFMSSCLQRRAVLLSGSICIVRSPPGRYGCGTWYLLSILILHLIAVISFFCIYKWYYWRRQRNESLLRDEQVSM